MVHETKSSGLSPVVSFFISLFGSSLQFYAPKFSGKEHANSHKINQAQRLQRRW
jgi:hypothetical protein